MAQKVYFLADDSVHSFNSDLWVSDGTSAGTHPVGGAADGGVAHAATDGLAPDDLTVFGDEMIFAGADSLKDGASNGLWLTDGTPLGTTEIGGASPGTGASPITGASNQGLHPSNITAFGSKAIFTGLDSGGNTALWVTDGTASGTIELGGLGNKGVVGSAASVGAAFSPENFSAFGNSVLFDAIDSRGNMGLWISDGTTAGTVEIGGIKNALIADAHHGSFVATDSITLGDFELFNAKSAGGNPSLWLTDGTTGGTVELGGVNNAGIAGADNAGLGAGLAQAVRLGNRVFFAGNDTSYDTGLWTTDGTASGTLEIGGIGDAGVANANPLGLTPTNLVTFGPLVLFNGEDKNWNDGLWVSDGTAAHTLELSANAPNEAVFGLNPEDIVDLGDGKAVFVGFDDSNGQAAGKATLWVTDGTVAGTQEIGGLDNAGVAGINAANGLSLEIGSLKGGDGLAYFIGQNSAGQNVLFETDGTLIGTKIVPGTNVAASGLTPQDLTLGPVPTADDTFSGSAKTIVLANIPGENLTLEQAPNEAPDTVTGSNGTITLIEAVASVSGGGNLIWLRYKAGHDDSSSSTVVPSVTLSNANGNTSTVFTGDAAHSGKIVLSGAQANVYGENDTITFASGTTGNIVNIYDTGGAGDTVSGSNGTVNLYGPTAIVNGSGNTLNVSDSGGVVTILGTTAGLNTVNDSSATIDVKSGGGTYLIGADDTITVAGGGTLAVAGGTTLKLDKTESIAGAITGAGQLSVTAGVTTIGDGATLSVANIAESGASTKLYVRGSSYAGVLTQSAGTLTLPGTLTLTGINNWLAGAINGGGTLAVAGGSTTITSGANLAVANVTESGAATHLFIGTQLYGGALTVNSGTLTMTGTLTLKGTNSFGGTFYGDGGTLAVAGGSTTIRDGTTLAGMNLALSGATTKLTVGTVTYAGALTQTAGTLTLSGNLTLIGSTNSLSGAIGGPGQLSVGGGATTIATGSALTVDSLAGVAGNLSIGTLTYAGALTMSGGTLTLPGTLTLRGANNTLGTTTSVATIAGAGTLAITGGVTTFDYANLTMAAWSISRGAVVKIAEATSYAGAFTMSGGALSLTSAFSLTGAATITSGIVFGAQYLVTSGSAKSISDLTVSGNIHWENTATVSESGTSVTIGGNTGTALLDNNATGIYDLLGDVGLLRGTSTTSNIKNEGLLEKTGGTGVSTIVPNVSNTGTIEVTAGTLDFQGAVTGAGTDTIFGASTLEFDSSVDVRQTIFFAGNGGTLDLGAPQTFHGGISGFDIGATGDAIDILSGWTFTGATEKAGSTTLNFIDGATQATLVLYGNYTGTFSATAITGGTKITYAA